MVACLVRLGSFGDVPLPRCDRADGRTSRQKAEGGDENYQDADFQRFALLWRLDREKRVVRRTPPYTRRHWSRNAMSQKGPESRKGIDSGVGVPWHTCQHPSFRVAMTSDAQSSAQRSRPQWPPPHGRSFRSRPASRCAISCAGPGDQPCTGRQTAYGGHRACSDKIASARVQCDSDKWCPMVLPVLHD
jgi:hypothetical protein